MGKRNQHNHISWEEIQNEIMYFCDCYGHIDVAKNWQHSVAWILFRIFEDIFLASSEQLKMEKQINSEVMFATYE